MARNNLKRRRPRPKPHVHRPHRPGNRWCGVTGCRHWQLDDGTWQDRSRPNVMIDRGSRGALAGAVSRDELASSW